MTTVTITETIHHGAFYSTRTEAVALTPEGLAEFLADSDYHYTSVSTDRLLGLLDALTTEGEGEHGWSRFVVTPAAEVADPDDNVSHHGSAEPLTTAPRTWAEWEAVTAEFDAAAPPARTAAPRRAPRAALSPFAMSYPATDHGDWLVLQGHADYCAANGHASYTRDGVVASHCPRCGALRGDA